jgi:hypothetical protein
MTRGNLRWIALEIQKKNIGKLSIDIWKVYEDNFDVAFDLDA